ncbi:hypothetical protein Ccar_05665 [Clostridium carboxidivorans P7]|uniref:Uncharacterized protein n=1 Tax=Clostridium carboxidivorans P7 TaxID=536227 RepID=C6PPQ7_9CLOT|nr:hypothetical protein [Clostridium carboxidivorans]AKN30335.1 hypothetical protein Ccar_05665 [Clostridium carboxidivorans P7]EET88787.1 hypothetical protein CcarbDRAFT_0774 [Clostridium carboxidivorans P7]
MKNNLNDKFTNIINYNEIKKLDNMYCGDCVRDASSGIRGFLFQDLVALNYLVDEKTEYICSEYLEDVDVFCKDSIIKVMQVKYYPKTSPNREEIMGDLYYQYLRFKVLKSTFNPMPVLVIHRSAYPKETTFKEMQDNIVRVKRSNKPEEIVDPEDWLKKKVYCFEKKEKQKEALFERAAYDSSIYDFLNIFRIIHVKESIKDYKMQVAKKIDSCIIDKGEFEDEDIRQQVLLGLSMNFIQKRYDENTKSGLDEFKCNKIELIKYLSQHLKIKSEECITAYLATLVNESFIDIVEDNIELTDEQISMLDVIYKNTQVWICKLAQNVDGQYKLLNTISFYTKDKLTQFKKLDVNSRYNKIIAQEDNIFSFLYYLWKIMMNLNTDLLKNTFNLNVESLTPEFYIDNSVGEYISMKFKGDTVDSSIIIPEIAAGRENKKHDDIYSRMFEVKPKKWYMSGSFGGNYEYTFNVADTGDGTSVFDVGKDSYRIECMECIEIDKGKWYKAEECSKCIFTNNCVKGKDY